MSDNDRAIQLYLQRIGEIDALAKKLVEFADDHGCMVPEDVEREDADRLTHALLTLQAAWAILGTS